MSASVTSFIHHGATSRHVVVECHLSNNLPTIVISGSASKMVQEAKDRLRGAFMNSGLRLPRRRVTLNLAPAEIPKADTGLDLAMAASVLVADQQVMALSPQQAVIGELSLDGSLRPVRGIIGRIRAGVAYGITEWFIPSSNLAQAQMITGVTLYPIDTLQTFYEHLAGKRPVAAVLSGRKHATKPATHDGPTLDSIIGQDQAKRAILIAAAGGHNILLSGPPGTGKSLLARALASVLPPLSHTEMLEVTQLHSLLSHNYEALVTQRPVRQPHHSASLAAMLGGSSLRPGEISLSHHGVLLLDELPEFTRPALEALRQPLEDHTITVARSKDSVRYPAKFIMAATANPCPCGFSGIVDKTCVCSQAELRRYQNRLSGPIMDRLDLFCFVDCVDNRQLLTAKASADTQAAMLSNVTKARRRQLQRLGTSERLNSDLTNLEIRRLAGLQSAARSQLNEAADRLQLSGRAYIRTVRVARTIADLEDSPAIKREHIMEAIGYRQR